MPKSLDPDQARRSVGPDLDTNLLYYSHQQKVNYYVSLIYIVLRWSMETLLLSHDGILMAFNGDPEMPLFAVPHLCLHCMLIKQQCARTDRDFPSFLESGPGVF